jgi:glycerophosphoryl diester phosphodiesterase
MDNKTIIPSSYATTAKNAGLLIVPWTFERSGPLANVAANGDYYYTSIAAATHTDGQLFEILDVLVHQVGIKAMFSDWASTLTYFANCFGIEFDSTTK